MEQQGQIHLTETNAGITIHYIAHIDQAWLEPEDIEVYAAMMDLDRAHERRQILLDQKRDMIESTGKQDVWQPGQPSSSNAAQSPTADPWTMELGGGHLDSDGDLAPRSRRIRGTP